MNQIIKRCWNSFMAMSIAVTAVAQAPSAMSAKKNKSDMRVELDSVDFRTDLTRVYGRLIGRPHTAQRIDYVTLRTPGVVLAAQEIDGVDLERYFQWEDDGVIPIEIDFAPSTKSNTVELEMLTVYGTVKSQPTPLNKKGRAIR